MVRAELSLWQSLYTHPNHVWMCESFFLSQTLWLLIFNSIFIYTADHSVHLMAIINIKLTCCCIWKVTWASTTCPTHLFIVLVLAHFIKKKNSGSLDYSSITEYYETINTFYTYLFFYRHYYSKICILKSKTHYNIIIIIIIHPCPETVRTIFKHCQIFALLLLDFCCFLLQCFFFPS